MGGKSCFFIGHREVSEEIYPALYAAVERHIVEYGVTEFIVGHYGGSDRLAMSAVKEPKCFYPEVKLTLLLPYHPAERPVSTPDGFDSTFYPPGMESVPRKIAIVRANRYVAGYHSGDGGQSIELKGTIYVSISNGPNIFYYDPVYQAPAGEVYLVSGQGMSHSGDLSAGMSGTHTLNEEQTVTVDGKSETVRSSIEVSTYLMDAPVSTGVLQFDKSGRVVSREDHAAGDLPGTITARSDTAYIIVETYMQSASGEETVARALFQEDAPTLYFSTCREDGICVKEHCGIIGDQKT